MPVPAVAAAFAAGADSVASASDHDWISELGDVQEKLYDTYEEGVELLSKFSLDARSVSTLAILLSFVYLTRRTLTRAGRRVQTFDLMDFRIASGSAMSVANSFGGLYFDVISSYLPGSSALRIHIYLTLAALFFTFVAYSTNICCKARRFALLAKAQASRRAHRGKPRRVAIFHMSIGAGHKRAAQAISEAIKSKAPDTEVDVVDVLDLAGTGYELIAKKGYMSAIQHDLGAAAYGFFFEASNVKKEPGFLTKVLNQAWFLPFYEYLFKTTPDFIISTHFTAPQLIASLRRDIGYDVPHVTVVTDYDAHAIWANMPCDRYFVPREDAMHMLEYFGIPRRRMTRMGIPIVMPFTHLPSKEEAFAQLQAHHAEESAANPEKGMAPLRDDLPTVLQMSGGSDVFKLHEELLKMEAPTQIIVITGRQADVRSRLSKMSVPKRHSVVLVGFTNTMHLYLRIADLIVSKPGGLTTAESMACGTPMVIVNPIPGQETRNTDLLLEAGVAIKVNDEPILGFRVNSLLSDTDRLRTMQERAVRFGEPTAALEIADAVLNGEIRASAGLDGNESDDESAEGAAAAKGGVRRRRRGKG